MQYFHLQFILNSVPLFRPWRIWFEWYSVHNRHVGGKQSARAAGDKANVSSVGSDRESAGHCTSPRCNVIGLIY